MIDSKIVNTMTFYEYLTNLIESNYRRNIRNGMSIVEAEVKREYAIYFRDDLVKDGMTRELSKRISSHRKEMRELNKMLCGDGF